MNFFQQSFLFPVTLLCAGACLWADSTDQDLMKAYIERAYNFDLEALEWFESDEMDQTDPMNVFVAATASYWVFQADRIERDKRDHAEKLLDRSVEVSEEYFKRNKFNAFYRFLYGSSRCNRARFHVEESSWFRAYLDAREGLGVLRDLIEDEPDFIDAQFAIGVAECFLSDAPAILKPLARLLGFRGSAEQGIEKLKRCMEAGEWTQTEAAYYLAYYYYNVVSDGPNAIVEFSKLRERYPSNPLFLYFLGRPHQINRDPLRALAVYVDARDVSYRTGADDMGNWSSFRVGTILQGEQRYEDALREYSRLQGKLSSEMHHQEYFYLLPLKMAQCLIAMGDEDRAKMYLNVIRPEWDKDAYREAKDLLKTL